MLKAQQVLKLFENMNDPIIISKEVSLDDMLKSFEKNYEKFSKKDYWELQPSIDKKIKERDYFVSQGKLDMENPNNKLKFSDEAIKKSILDDNYKNAKDMVIRVYNALKNKDSEYLKQVLRGTQVFTLSIINDLYGLNLKNNNDITNFIIHL